jgi:hypothetical protein
MSDLFDKYKGSFKLNDGELRTLASHSIVPCATPAHESIKDKEVAIIGTNKNQRKDSNRWSVTTRASPPSRYQPTQPAGSGSIIPVDDSTLSIGGESSLTNGSEPSAKTAHNKFGLTDGQTVYAVAIIFGLILACAMIYRVFVPIRHGAPAPAAAPIAAHVVAREETVAIAGIENEEELAAVDTERMTTFVEEENELPWYTVVFARDDNGSSHKVGFKCDFHPAPLPAVAARPTEMIF